MSFLRVHYTCVTRIPIKKETLIPDVPSRPVESVPLPGDNCCSDLCALVWLVLNFI